VEDEQFIHTVSLKRKEKKKRKEKVHVLYSMPKNEQNKKIKGYTYS
jgi:hypothetical protein